MPREMPDPGQSGEVIFYGVAVGAGQPDSFGNGEPAVFPAQFEQFRRKRGKIAEKDGLTLATLANCLDPSGQGAAALEHNREAIEALREDFLRHRMAVAHWLVTMLKRYHDR